jgi:hypothetical protein
MVYIEHIKNPEVVKGLCKKIAPSLGISILIIEMLMSH